MGTIPTEQILISALNRFCFREIWNEVLNELRANIAPTSISERSKNGTVTFYGQQYQLPDTTSPFYLYSIPVQLMYVYTARQLPSDWIHAEDLCNKYDILLHVYHLTGKMCPKSHIYFKRIGSYVIMAIRKTAIERFIPFAQKNDIRLTMYLDSDSLRDVTCKSFYIPYTDHSFVERTKVDNYIKSHPEPLSKVMVYSNGYEIPYTNAGSLELGTYVDVIHDSNTILNFTVDLSDPTQAHVYYSDRDELYKQIIHIPKHLNPDNKLLTHNTCDIHVRGLDINGNPGKGLYLHRCADESVDQITHNDISIPTYILDAYRDYLETQSIEVRIMYRQHDKDNHLIRDKNYVDLLYTLDDKTIVDHLMGRISSKLSFWKASELEKSKYVEMMFDVPNVVTPETMWDYVEGLGYYHVLALLCQKIVSSYMYEGHTNHLRVGKPYVYYDKTIFPLVYLDGVKVPSNHVTCSHVDELTIDVGIADHINIPSNTTMTVEMFLGGNTETFAIEPHAGEVNITVPFTELVILEEFDISIHPADALDEKRTRAYVQFTDFPGNVIFTKTEKSTSILFGPTCYGRKFIIQNRECVFRGERYLDADLLQGNPIYITLEDGVIDQGYTAPLWDPRTVKVFFNGHYLIQGIDYEIYETRDRNDKFCCYQISMQNYEYMKSSDNYIEWFVTSSVVENKVTGYVIDDQAAVQDSLALLFDNLTTVHVAGSLERDVQDHGNIIQLPIGKYEQGVPFEVMTTVPKLLQDFLSKYHPNTDTERLSILNEYFYGKQPIYPDTIVIPNSHKCFSNYTVMIVRDIVNKTLAGISVDADLERMKSQFVNYQHVFARDLVMQESLDLMFVDVYPHYTDMVVEGPELYKLLQAFIKLVMPKDTYTSGVVSYDN